MNNYENKAKCATPVWLAPEKPQNKKNKKNGSRPNGKSKKKIKETKKKYFFWQCINV